MEMLSGWYVPFPGVLAEHSVTCWLSALVIVGVVIIVHNRLARSTSVRHPSTAPGYLPLLGHSLAVLYNQSRLLDYIHDITLELGQKTWCWHLPFMPVYINIFSPANLEHVLRTRFDNYPKGHHWQSRFGCLMGGGIFNVDGPSWRQQRKTASHMFNVKSFKLYFERAFAQSMPLLLSRLQRSADQGTAIDVQDLMQRFTLDTFCKIGFDFDAGCLSGDQLSPFAGAFDRVQWILNRRFFTPSYWLEELVTGRRWELAHDLKVLDDYSYAMIKTRRAEMQRHSVTAVSSNGHSTATALKDAATQLNGFTPPQHSTHEQQCDDVASVCDDDDDDNDVAGSTCGGADGAAELEAAAAPAGSSGRVSSTVAEEAGPFERSDLLSMFVAQVDEQGVPLTDEVLRDHVLNFIIAGRDTTAAALSWSLLMLAQHPECAQQLVAEVDAVMAGMSADALPTYDQVHEMRWAKCVLLETLRLYPSVPKDAKQAAADDTLPDGTFIPKGAMVLYHPYTMGRLESLWGPDAVLFRPQRWLDRPTAPTAFEYPAFNAGPRTCLGQNLALIEGVFVLACILRRYQLALVPDQDLCYANSVTLPLKNGVRFTIRSRS